MKAETRKKLEGFIRFSIEDPAECAEALALLCGIAKPGKQERDKWLKSREAAEIANVSRKTILLWGRLGYLHSRKHGKRRLRFSRNELLQFMEDGPAGVAK